MKLTALVLDLFKNDRYFKRYSSAVDVLTELKIPLLNKQLDKNNLLSHLYEITSGYDAVVLAYVDSPFYCLKENKKLLNDFTQYRGDYGFADNHPKGVVMEILRREALPVMENVRQQKNILITRDVFHEIAFKDVNMFDLENLYAEVSLRTFRLSFFRDNQQDAHTIDTLQALLKEKKYNQSFFFNDLAHLIKDNREKLKTIPKFFEVEIASGCYQACSFCPQPKLGLNEEFMNLKNYQKILKNLKSLTHNPIISFTGLGEAVKNPQWLDIVKHTLNEGVECLLETSLSGLNDNVRDQIINLANDKLIVIISIDAIDEDLYKQLRPQKESFAEKKFTAILEEIENVLLKRPKNTYVQLIKMNENFENIVAFHKYFSKYTDNIIIQKYNHYRGFLPERRLNPMQPFETIDCWHLKRDVVIKVNGDVPVCRQDLKKEHLLGNMLSDSIEQVVDRGKKYFKKHIEGWNFCENCDEYYTYNY